MLSSQGASSHLSGGIVVRQTIGQQSIIGNFKKSNLIFGQGFQQNSKIKLGNSAAFVVNTNTNTIRYSYDGTNWSNTTIGSQNGNAVIWTNPHIGTMNIVQPTLVGGSGTNTMAYSTDGIQYRALGNSIFTNSCNDIGWNGSIWVAVGSGGNTIAYSTDGLSWTPLGSATYSNRGYLISWKGTVWLALGSG